MAKHEKKIWTLGVLSAIVLLVLVSVFSPGNPRSSVTMQEDASGSAPSSSQRQDKAAQAKIGEVVEVGDFVYKVDDISYRHVVGNVITHKKAEGVYLLVKLDIQNISDKARSLDNSLFKLRDERGKAYNSSNEGSIALELSGIETLFLKQFQPHIQTCGYLIFEVPQEAVYHLNVSGGFLSGEKGDIALIISDPS